MSILEYLYERYDCSNLDELEAKCPLNLDNINLNNIMYKEFEKLLDNIEKEEYDTIYKIVQERAQSSDTKRYSVEFINGDEIEFKEI